MPAKSEDVDLEVVDELDEVVDEQISTRMTKNWTSKSQTKTASMQPATFPTANSTRRVSTINEIGFSKP